MMSTSTDRAERIKLPMLSLKVHGITVPQPIALIEENLRKYLRKQAEVLENIHSTDRNDQEHLHQYGRDLIEIHGNIRKWGRPLRDFASYKYPHPDSLVAT